MVNHAMNDDEYLFYSRLFFLFFCFYYRVSKNVLYPKMQNFKNFIYNKDNRIWYFDLFK